MNLFRFQFFLPVFLISITSAVHAAPKVPAKAPVKTPVKVIGKTPAAPKPLVLPANSPLVAAQFKRISKAYTSLGSFSVNVVDIDGRGADAQHLKYTAYFGTDGRLGSKLTELDSHGVPTGNVQSLLYDGHEVILSTNGGPAQRHPAKDGTNDYSRSEDFFSSAFGAEFIGEVARYSRDPKSVKLEGKYWIQTLPGGKTRMENDVVVGTGPKSAQVVYSFLVGTTGLVENIAVTGKQNGKEVFHEEAKVSQPASIASGLLTWEKFGPPPNPNFTIDVASQDAFKRAAKLYGQAKSFSTKISGTVNDTPPDQNTPPPWSAEIEWERRGRVRLQSSSGSMNYAYDGANSYLITDGKLRTVKTASPNPDQMSFRMINSIVLNESSFIVFNRALLTLLQGRYSEFIDGPTGINSRKVTLETGQNLEGSPCSVADEIVTAKTKTDLVTLESHYWFADSDGRLLRVTTDLKQKDFQSNVDVRLVDQQIDPALPDSTWKLAEPVENKPTG